MQPRRRRPHSDNTNDKNQHHQQQHVPPLSGTDAAAARTESRHAATTSRPEDRSKSSVETVEAKLNRWSKAYQAAMECNGAWHRLAATSSTTTTAADAAAAAAASSSLLPASSATMSLADTLMHVGRSARQTLETAILHDPLIVQDGYAPALNYYHHHHHSNGPARVSQSMTTTTTTAFKSAGHKAQVRQLVYVSLVNYSDLLMGGCPHPDPSSSSSRLLDRGLVAPLVVFVKQSCWRRRRLRTQVSAPASQPNENDKPRKDNGEGEEEEEPIEETIRRALTALLDAVALDGSDPVVWLKLACLARRLGSIVARKVPPKQQQHHQPIANQTNVTAVMDTVTIHTTPPIPHVAFWKYRRLERYALEQGRLALGDQVPPNRLVVQALEEWWQEETEPPEYPSVLVKDNGGGESMTLQVELTRYSWSALARLLLRACREGSDLSSQAASTMVTMITEPTLPEQCVSGYYRNLPKNHNTLSSYTFSSPKMQVKLSPLIALPSMVLARICQYLPPREMWCFEATCRALAYSIVSGRAALDHLSRNFAAAATVAEKEVAPVVPNESTQKGRIEPIDPSQEQKGQQSEQTTTTSEENESSAQNLLAGIENKKVDAPSQEKTGNAEAARSPSRTQKEKVPRSPRAWAHGSRTSKRLLTQQINSGKRSDREHRRNNLCYCLLTAVLGCSENDPVYKRILEESRTIAPLDNTGLRQVAASRGATDDTVNRRAMVGSSQSLSRQKEEARERISDASLLAFCHKWSSFTPIQYLFGLLAHVSLHVHHVVSSDSSGSLVLSSVLLECK